MSALTDLLGCHPSWEPRLLAVMERDHPGLLKEALGTAVSENAVEQVAKRKAAEAEGRPYIYEPLGGREGS